MNLKKSYVVQVLFLLVLSSCVSLSLNKRYVLTTNTDMINKYHSETKNTSNYVGVNGGVSNSSFTSRVLNKTILIPKSLENEEILLTTIDLIVENKPKKLSKYLNKFNSSSEYLYFCKGVLKLVTYNFSEAKELFKLNNNKDLQIMNEILLVDCDFEIQKRNRSRVNKNIYFIKYQDILDNLELNNNYKLLINQRIKFIKN